MSLLSILQHSDPPQHEHSTQGASAPTTPSVSVNVPLLKGGRMGHGFAQGTMGPWAKIIWLGRMCSVYTTKLRTLRVGDILP